MALTKAQVREILSAAGVDAEHMKETVDKIIDGHVATVEALNEKINTYKADAEKLPTVQKELDDLKAAGDGGYKEKYEKEHADFEKYKADQTAKETRQAKETAYREFLKSVGVSEKRIPSILKVTDLDKLEMDGEKFKDADKLTESVKAEWADFIETSNTDGANTNTPPANNNNNGEDPSKMTMEQYIAYRNKK